jgi:elongation of very long chain fatty acids protein 6
MHIHIRSELFDTFFIVIHKKPLLLLHWYHHISVLLYCWHSFVTKAPSGLIFIVMNYGVHSLMYFYYFLMVIKAKPKWFNSIYITVAQISQMAVGVTTTILGFFLTPKYDKACWLTKDNNTAAMIMYGSYFILFVQFFVERYYFKAAKKPKTTKKTD